jgi:two-component system chemotaxis response regulator CheB
MSGIRVVTVDDSPLFLEVLRDALEQDGDIEVVAEAEDARSALSHAARCKPDLMTLDLSMPGQDGLTTLEQLMAQRPVPVLVLTAQPTRGERDLVYEATRRGALEVLEKREACGTPDAQARLRELVRELARVQVVRHLPARHAFPLAAARPRAGVRGPLSCPVVGLGASAGGPLTLSEILSRLPRDLPACVAVVQHMSAGFADSFARYLQRSTDLEVRVVEKQARAEAGAVLLPAEGRHLVAIDARTFAASDAEPVHRFRPSVDVLLSSLAWAHGPNAIGAVLTGMGDDGTLGLLDMRRAGAITFAQDEESSVVFGMPRAAIQAGAAQRALSREALPAAIEEAVASILSRPASVAS